MARLSLEPRRLLADAVAAGSEVRLPVTGGQLVAAGVTPGPHVGHALQLTYDALVDGVITTDEALAWALRTARGLAVEIGE
jgi:hypothetical protein